MFCRESSARHDSYQINLMTPIDAVLFAGCLFLHVEISKQHGSKPKNMTVVFDDCFARIVTFVLSESDPRAVHFDTIF